MPDQSFAEWLDQEITTQQITPADVARAAGMRSNFIYKLLRDPNRQPSIKSCLAFARALKKSPITIFRAAGYLPADVNFPELEDFKETLGQLSEEGRQEMLAFVRLKLELERMQIARKSSG